MLVYEVSVALNWFQISKSLCRQSSIWRLSSHTHTHTHTHVYIMHFKHLPSSHYWRLHVFHIYSPHFSFLSWHSSLVCLRTSSELRTLGAEWKGIRHRTCPKKSLCSAPLLRLIAPVGVNKLQIVLASRLLNSWKENLQLCLLSYSKEIKLSIFTKWNSLEIKEVVAAPWVVFHGACGAKKGQLSSPGTWGLMRRDRAREKDTSNAMISISIRQINAANHSDDTDAQRHLSACVRVMSI